MLKIIFPDMIPNPNEEKCGFCKEYFDKKNLTDVHSCEVCEDCYSEEVRDCSKCNVVGFREDMKLADNDYFCDECFEECWRYCDDCGETFPRDEVSYHENAEMDLCNNCYDYRESEREENNAEEIVIPFQIEQSKIFVQNKFKNTCGVELETINQNEDSFSYEELKDFGFSQYGDGSLDSNGVEFVSNAFSGDLLFNRIDDFCKELKNRGYEVNSSCGLHIHIKTSKRIDNLKKIIVFYKKFEPLFFKMVSTSRQGNQYCKKFDNEYYNFDFVKIMGLKNSQELQTLLYHIKSPITLKRYKGDKYNEKRYNWVNIHSIFHRGTLEIRNHNATINIDKIKNWLMIHLTILDFLKKLNIDIIYNLPETEEFFLSLFHKDLRKYIIQRWNNFKAELNPKIENN